jgi:hypothetical protein
MYVGCHGAILRLEAHGALLETRVDTIQRHKLSFFELMFADRATAYCGGNRLDCSGMFVCACRLKVRKSRNSTHVLGD